MLDAVRRTQAEDARARLEGANNRQLARYTRSVELLISSAARLATAYECLARSQQRLDDTWAVRASRASRLRRP